MPNPTDYTPAQLLALPAGHVLGGAGKGEEGMKGDFDQYSGMTDEQVFAIKYTERSFGYLDHRTLNELVHKWIFGRSGEPLRYSDSNELVGDLVVALFDFGRGFFCCKDLGGGYGVIVGGGYDMFSENGNTFPEVLCMVLLISAWRKIRGCK